MSEYALHTVFISPEQAKKAIAGQIAPYCRDLWARGIERVAVTLQPEEDAKTVQQNKFYWGVVLREISEQARIEGQRYTVDAWHELFKRQFLPRITKRTRVAGKPRPVVTTTIGSTQGLSVKKMSAYIEQVMAFAQTDLSVKFSAQRWEDYR